MGGERGGGGKGWLWGKGIAVVIILSGTSKENESPLKGARVLEPCFTRQKRQGSDITWQQWKIFLGNSFSYHQRHFNTTNGGSLSKAYVTVTIS